MARRGKTEEASTTELVSDVRQFWTAVSAILLYIFLNYFLVSRLDHVFAGRPATIVIVSGIGATVLSGLIVSLGWRVLARPEKPISGEVRAKRESSTALENGHDT